MLSAYRDFRADDDLFVGYHGNIRILTADIDNHGASCLRYVDTERYGVADGTVDQIDTRTPEVSGMADRIVCSLFDFGHVDRSGEENHRSISCASVRPPYHCMKYVFDLSHIRDPAVHNRP